MHCEEDGRGGSYLMMEPWCFIYPQRIFISSLKAKLILVYQALLYLLLASVSVNKRVIACILLLD